MAVTQYNSSEWVLEVAGVNITQLGEDGVSGAKDEERISSSVGILGDTIESVIKDDRGTITFSVQPTCPQLPHLMSLEKTTEFFSILATNKSLGISYGGTKASLKNVPEISGGNEAEDLEFEVQVYDYSVDMI